VILVFGGGGQFATELACVAAAEGVGLATLAQGLADITQPEQVKRAVNECQPSLVVNAAAYTAVDKAESEPALAMAVNADGPRVLADACAEAGVPLVHVSTDYVFDGEKSDPYVEDDPIAPLGVYGRSKAAGEAAVRTAWPKHVILRTAWLYGVHGTNFLKTMLRLAAERDELNVVADQRGSPTCTADLARAILVVATAVERGEAPWGTYHVAGTGETTWHGLASRIVEVQSPSTGRRPRVNAITTAEYTTPARRPRNSVLDSSKFAATFGYRAPDWTESVDRTVASLMAKGVSA
jgi:dTDP-4-dehydrorhamnose reductase